MQPDGELLHGSTPPPRWEVITLRARFRRDKARPSARADSEIQFLKFVRNRGTVGLNRRSGEKFGARVAEVEEPVVGAKSILFEFEVDEVAEPKALSTANLTRALRGYAAQARESVW